MSPSASAYRYEVSATSNLVLILGGGFVSAFVCGWSTCSSSWRCIDLGTCVRANDGICGFNNRVSITADAQFGTETSTESLSSLLRGLCSPGDRTQLDPQTGEVVCVPFFTFPRGINTEIMDSAGTTPATQACGRWIDAGGSPLFITRVQRRGWSDESEWQNSLFEAEDAATKDSRIATSAMSKFRAECQRTSLAGSAALRIAATAAYRYFEEYIDSNTDRRGFLRSIGFVTGHLCATTVSIGSFLQWTGNHQLHFGRGYTFGTSTLSSALAVFGEPVELQRHADEANQAILNYETNSFLTQPTSQDLYDVLQGASGLENFTVSLDLSDHRLLAAALMFYDLDSAKAIAYVKGMSAFCSYNTWSSFLDSSNSYTDTLDAEMQSIKSDRPPASALARLRSVGEHPDIYSDALNASTITIAHIASTSTTGNREADCLNLMRAVFVDEVEAARFDATVSRSFYDRLQHLVLTTRVGIGIAANSEPIKGVINNVSLFTQRVSSAGVRIVGAPRGSWAGLARALPRAEMTSSDGMFLMVLKQARATFMDSVVESGMKGTVSTCDHDPFSQQVTWNAYAIPSLDCTVYFLGMLHRPMADEQYDDATLMSRWLHVVGHELGHIAESVGWDQTNYTNFLKHYDANTRSEAIADVIGAVAILSTGMVTRGDFISLFCQIWCSRMPYGWTHPVTMRHPSGNSRCDNLVATLDEFYPNFT